MFIKCLIILLYFCFLMFEFSILVHFGRCAGRAACDNDDNLATWFCRSKVLNKFSKCPTDALFMDF